MVEDGAEGKGDAAEKSRCKGWRPENMAFPEQCWGFHVAEASDTWQKVEGEEVVV